jgi:hypothetical protein
VLKLVETGDFKGENMKKLIVLALFLSVVVLPAYGQTIPVSDLVDVAIYRLGKPVPDGFQRTGMNSFVYNGASLRTQNDVVSAVTFGLAFETRLEAAAFSGYFYGYFENSHNWTFRRTIVGAGLHGSLYENNGVFAFIQRPSQRYDGLIVAQIVLSRGYFGF